MKRVVAANITIPENEWVYVDVSAFTTYVANRGDDYYVVMSDEGGNGEYVVNVYSCTYDAMLNYLSSEEFEGEYSLEEVAEMVDDSDSYYSDQDNNVANLCTYYPGYAKLLETFGPYDSMGAANDAVHDFVEGRL